jgi:hypothetical protein
MFALVGNVMNPARCLGIDVGQIGKGAQWPEILA